MPFSLVCKGCTGPRQPGRQLCDECRDSRRKARKKKYDRARKRPAEIVATQQKRWYNRMVSDAERYEAKLAYKRKWNAKHTRRDSKCPLCGAEREYGKRYCTNCRIAFREYSQASYNARRKRKGFNRDNSAVYKRRVEKYGREAIALAAKVRYHLRKERKGSRNED